MKEIEDDRNRWRDSPCSWIGRPNIVNATVLLKAVYKLNASPIKLSMAIFTESGQESLQFVGKHKRPQLAKAIRRNKVPDLDYTTKLQSSKEHGTHMVQRQRLTE